MPRRRAPPRLYLDRKRRQWVIRDGNRFLRTGCAETDRARAETRLAAYLGQKHQPERGQDPLIADVLLVYAREHLPHTKAAKNAAYNISNLATFWGNWRSSDITAKRCREYASGRRLSAARRDLEVLRSAIRYYAREHGSVIPGAIVLPPKSEPRSRWLTRSEAARLLKAARHTQHLKRFILIALYTGSRPGVILRLQWDQIDISRGVMARRALGEAPDAPTKRAPRVRLGRRILSHLRRWRRHDGAEVRYLCHYNGRRVKQFRRTFPAAARAAGLIGVTPHTLRHTRATWLMQEGVPIWEAAGALGMSTVTLERIYGHHHPDWQKRAAEV